MVRHKSVTPSDRQVTVPTSRIGRLARFGLLAGELMVGSAIETARRLGNTAPADGTTAVFSLRNARVLAERLARLRGAAMKLGQLLSMESKDLLPPELAEALAILRSNAYAMPSAQLEQVLAAEYGKNWRRRFAGFDFKPLAAASIGQVHRVRTEDGRDLALKIQYPGIAKSIDSDVDNVAVLLRLANLLPVELDVDGVVAEAKRQLRRETDYSKEAANLDRFAELIGDEPSLAVPKVHRDLSTKRVLAMDLARGTPLDALAADEVAQRRRDAVGATLERLVFRELFEFRLMQTDPNPANYLYDGDTRRVHLLDFGSVRAFPAPLVARYANLTRAIIDDDRDAVQRLAQQIGYLAPGDSADRVTTTVKLLFEVCEPLRQRGPYDFGASDLPLRASQGTFFPALLRGGVRLPPPHTIFLHRKLVGSFLLCAQIKARVDVAKLIKPFLDLY